MKQKITKTVMLFLLSFIGITHLNAQWSELGGTGALAANNQIRTLCKDPSGNIYAAGNFINSGGKFYVAKWDGNSWTELGGINALNANNTIFALCSDASGNIYAAGSFLNGSNKRYVAKWNGINWSELGGTNALNANSTIFTVYSDASGNIYAAGLFTNASNKKYVAKYNGSGWSELGGSNALAANGDINTLCSDASGNIYAAGLFSNASNKKYVAKYNGIGWSELGGTNALAASNTIFSICIDASGNIYAGGAFSNTNAKRYVAKYNGSSWSELGGTNALALAGNNGSILAICCDLSGNIYTCGNFANANARYFVAKYNGSSWSELGGTNALAANNFMFALCIDANTNVYTGGTFTNASGKEYVAKYTTPPCSPNTGTFAVSSCGSYTWTAKGNKVYTASNNTDTIHLTNVGGCDSLVTLDLTINNASSSITNTSICPSQLPYSWNGSRTAAGTYTYTTTNSQGCDSVATLTLTVIQVVSTYAYDTICSSQLPYTWLGKTFNAAGSQPLFLTSSQGCDSIVTLVLAIKANYTITASGGAGGSISNAGVSTICEGDNSTTYSITPNSGYHITDVVVDGISQGAVTTYSFSNVTANHTIAASFALSCTPSTSSSTQTACVSYTWNGTTYTNSGDYTAHFTNSCGLDSAATLHLTINAATSSTQTASVCSNQLPYTWNGLIFTAAGTQTKTGLVNSNGCDSSATLVLSVNTSSPSSISIISTATVICAGTLVTFTATPVNGGTNPIYQWKKNGANVGINSNVYTSTSLNNNDSIWCVLTSNSACATNANASSNKVKLTVNANPIITPITNGVSNITATSLCTLGATTRYYNATPYGVWSSDNGAVASVTGGSQSGSIAANSNGTATIKYTVSNTTGCSSSASLLVTVAQQATPNAITGNSVVCAGTTTTLGNTTTGGVWVSLNDRGTINATGIYSGNNAGGGQVKYTVTNAAGCSAFTIKNITVNAMPSVPTIGYANGTNTALFRYGTNFCVGKSCTVVGIPSGGSWAYTNPAAGTITSGGLVNFIGEGSGAIVYTYTDANGCSNSRTMSGTVAVCPIPKNSAAIGEGLLVSNDFTMYPNPAKGFIKLNVETLVGKGSIVVTDLYGKTVKNQPLSMGTNTIDIASLTKGFYLVSMITSEGKITKKLLVE